ncbi:type II toxin-antitoxin system Phd/YefM family antitoxin [Phenylobacterium sp.]|uniref:type II toxin-antitoxin system Phd/YefM family antitoxin n=1 Tax=Phenylobacterium sp. TaxID=1871053 RepID=UPI00301C20B8
MHAWKLETAKARLSEAVREAKANGPQTITVRGREAAVVISAEEYRRLTNPEGGKHWVDALREIGPIDIEFERDPSLFRDIDFDL